MFTLDIPVEQQATIIIADKSTARSSPLEQPDFILQECQVVSSGEHEKLSSAERIVSPALALWNYIQLHEQRPGVFDQATVDKISQLKVSLLKAPEHGRIYLSAVGSNVFHYDPVTNSQGKESAAFMVEFEGKRYKVIIELVVLYTNGSDGNCLNPPKLIRVNGKSTSNAVDIEDYTTPASWYRATSLYALFTGAAFHRDVRRGLFPANWASDIVDIPAGERDA